jgi:23S rRNA pseudouridine2605 synthase
VQVRLQKLLSSAGVASRRAAERLILEGRVSVNGRTVRELGTRADPGRDRIRVDGRPLPARPAPRYLLVYKPTGVVTTRHDPQGRPTVLGLLGRTGEYLYPVGRLDHDTEGLLLLTNDGELAARLTHPRHEIPRTYRARVRGVPDQRALERLARGIRLDGVPTAPAKVRLLAARSAVRSSYGTSGEAQLEITLHEGRNRQVRRMCEAIGHPVIALRRTRFGPLHDERLKPGAVRELTPREVLSLKKAAGLGPGTRS